MAKSRRFIKAVKEAAKVNDLEVLKEKRRTDHAKNQAIYSTAPQAVCP